MAATEYRVYPPDVIYITSLHVAEINNNMQRVRPDGKINLPLLGEVAVAGKTPKEIEQLLTEAAHKYYDKVAATVEVRSYESQRFYVFGQVVFPGPLPWTGRDTLLDALAKTQPNFLSWPERIIVTRGDDPKTGGFTTDFVEEEDDGYRKSGIAAERKDRPRKQMVINLAAMVEEGDMSKNILLQPNDVIYVQANPFAKVGLSIEQVLFPMRGLSETTRSYRNVVDDVRWIGDGQPRDNSATLRVR